MTPVFLSCVRDRRSFIRLSLIFFFVILSCQRLNFHGFVLVVKSCLNLSVPSIFIYKDMNIFISAISGQSVGSNGNGLFFSFYTLFLQ